jgi:hypothetical protein
MMAAGKTAFSDTAARCFPGRRFWLGFDYPKIVMKFFDLLNFGLF